MQACVNLAVDRRLAFLLLLAAFAGLLSTALRPAFSNAAPHEIEPVGKTELGTLSEPVIPPPTGTTRAPEPPPNTATVAPPPTEPDRFLTATVRRGRSLALYARPGGRIVARLGAETEFGSRQTLAVVERKGRWLGVLTPALPNGEIGWVKASGRSLGLARTSLSITIDLSRRRLVLRDGNEVVLRTTVGIGAPASPTPTGRFAVTDKLPGARYGPYYGCCILALSAHQPNLPPGWTGGNRMAIHGTSDPGSIGAASSAGCLRAREGDLRTLMRHVPLGTPVVIRP